MARSETWPTWKIIAVMVGAVVAAVALWVAGDLANSHFEPPGETNAPGNSIFTLGTVLQMFSLLGVGLALIMGGWLGWRYYRSIPAWRRRKGLPPPRR